MEKVVDRRIIVCDYCGSFLQDAQWKGLLAPCVICGKHTCSEHGAGVYFDGSIEHGVSVCREHLSPNIKAWSLLFD